MLGLLKFTGGKDSLFLLDEPDTHLNPAWTVKYLDLLRQFVPNKQASHLLMVTHHPLAIAELEKQQVQVMWADNEFQVHAHEPSESPRGMGYAGILTSDMFGLLTTLDNSTERLLRIRRSIIERPQLTDILKGRLEKLDAAISKFGFTTAHWDRGYEEYLRAKKQVQLKEKGQDVSTPSEIKKRRAVAENAIRSIKEKRGLVDSGESK